MALMIPRVAAKKPVVKTPAVVKPLPVVMGGVAGQPERQQTRLDFLQKTRPNDPEIALLKKKLANPVATAPGAPTPGAVTPDLSGQPAAPTEPTTGGGLQEPAPTDPNSLDTMFPNTRMFEPENYQGSPLYQFQVKMGQDQLAKSLAARGLTNSGKGIQDELNIPMMAAAQDTDRMTRVATDNANRLQTYQTNEADRRERAGNNQWDRSFNLAGLMAAQSPWTGALAGLNNSADITSEAGKSNANFLRDYYNRVMASGGGGGGRSGGGGSAGTPMAVPTGPDYSNITPTQIGGNYSSNSGWLNLLSQGLANLF